MASFSRLPQSSRFIKSFALAALIILLPCIYFLSSPSSPDTYDVLSGTSLAAGSVDLQDHRVTLDPPPDVLGGETIMKHLGNETAKAELGRASWKLLHLMTLRFPDTPTQDERSALKSYFYLFARLYPCGECAAHFQLLLKEYPPQTSSRKSASLWLCHLHNLINTRLLKPQFDCTTLDAAYDCGCGEDPDAAAATEGQGKSQGKDGLTGVELQKGG